MTAKGVPDQAEAQEIAAPLPNVSTAAQPMADEEEGNNPERQLEAGLIACVEHVLRMKGMNYSPAAIRDLPDLREGLFGPIDAASALMNLGFVASYGALKATEIVKGHCPLIAFMVDGSAVVITETTKAGFLTVASPSGQFVETLVAVSDFARDYAGFVVIASKPVEARKEVDAKNWFWGSLGQGKWLYTQVLVAAVVSNFLGLSTSLFIMVVYDRVVPNEAIESLIALTVGIMIALVFDFIIKTLRASFIDRAGKRADQRMSRMIFDKMLSMRLDKRSQKSGALASVVREFDTLREFFTSATLVAVVDLPFIIFFVWVISLIAGPLALVPLISVPIVIMAGLVVQPMLSRIASGSMDSAMSKQSVLVETLNGLETVQATGSGRLMRDRFEEASDAQSDLGLRNRVLTQFVLNSATSIQQVAQVAIIFYGVFLIRDGIITMGAMIAAVILSGKALGPLTQLASALSRANGARQAYRSLNALMSQDTGEGEPGQRLSRPKLDGTLEFRNVSYSFPGARSPIIRNLTLKIPAGQKVAVLGRMGSGKSTLARLASGLIQPSEGAILIDGVDLRQIDRSDLRRNVGVMLQDTWLFSGTLRENIQMGFYEYDDRHLLSIAKISGVDDFVAAHPMGYDLPIKERGEGLSGGQRQSINLARALMHEPNLLILDEPTSSMDSATEKSLIDRLKFWLRNRTLIVVTHRNTLVALADRVLVMDQGQIVADTTPERLKASAN
jgi:ATP-binding cassette subfamily C protein LapB